MTDDPTSAAMDQRSKDGNARRENVRIAELERSHVEAAVTMHMAAFPDFFLTLLGRTFLRQLYLAYANDPATVALVAVRTDDEKLLGAVIGPLEPGSFYKRLLLSRWWRFGLASTGAILRRPHILPRILRAVRYRGDAPEDGTARALLASIATSPEAQGLGIGRLMTSAFVERARQAGLPGVFLTTDTEHNDAVNNFYRKQGWTLEGSFTTPEGRKMNRYVFDFKVHPQ